MPRALLLLLGLGLAACGSESQASATAGPKRPTATSPEIERPYDEAADAQAQIDAAVAASRGDGKRVLLMFGANWCIWCRRLAWTLENDAAVAAALREGWRVVHVDVGARGSSTNRDVARRYGDPLGNGLPCLVVLDDAGGVAHVQETGALEDGDHHDPARVLAFLRDWRDGRG